MLPVKGRDLRCATNNIGKKKKDIRLELLRFVRSLSENGGKHASPYLFLLQKLF